MLIKIASENPQFEQDIALLKLKYRTGAASKAARLAIQDFSTMEIEREVLKGQNLSMADEIDRLRDLLSVVSDYRYKCPRCKIR
ncbi:MAG: hypothetical protein HRT52_22365 [Colwellia sp.]|nr:hypothetical protein [Colwellia sp.]